MCKHFHCEVICIGEKSPGVLRICVFQLVGGRGSGAGAAGWAALVPLCSREGGSIPRKPECTGQRGADPQQLVFPDSWEAAAPPVATSPFRLLDSGLQLVTWVHLFPSWHLPTDAHTSVFPCELLSVNHTLRIYEYYVLA